MHSFAVPSSFVIVHCQSITPINELIKRPYQFFLGESVDFILVNVREFASIARYGVKLRTGEPLRKMADYVMKH